MFILRVHTKTGGGPFAIGPFSSEEQCHAWHQKHKHLISLAEMMILNSVDKLVPQLEIFCEPYFVDEHDCKLIPIAEEVPEEDCDALSSAVALVMGNGTIKENRYETL